MRDPIRPRPIIAGLLTICAGLVLVSCGERTVHEDWNGGGPKRVGILSNGQQEGCWSYWYENGVKLARGSWHQDYQDGAWVWWYPNGQVRQEGFYAGRGLSPWHESSAPRTGHWRHFYENGLLYCEGYYLDDRQTGIWTFFNRDGKPFATGTFDRGIKDGEWTFWQDGGRPKLQGRYDEGLKSGLWTTWDADGAITLREDFSIPGHVAVASPAPAAATIPPTPAAPATPTVVASNPQAPPPTPTVTPPAQPTAVPVAQPAGQAAAQVPILPRISLDDLTLPDANAPPLSPIPVSPRLWTPLQEGDAGALIKHYTSGTGTLGSAYEDSGGQSHQRKDLIGKPLAQTRFLQSTGEVLDLKAFVGKRPVILVVLRGFSGQVCLYCATQTAALANEIQKFRDLGVEVVLVYPGPVEAVPVFIQAVASLRKDPPPLPIALDVSLFLVRSLAIEDNLARPTSLILDASGTVRYAYVGTNIADRPSVEDLLQAVKRIIK